MTPQRRASGPQPHPQREQESLRRENERLHRQVEQLRQQLGQQAEQLFQKDQQIVRKEQQIADGEKKIADLERQLALSRQNSTTSSKPPSSDGMAGEPRERGRKKKSKRKPGGQPGHAGACRPLEPTERVDEFRHVWPSECKKCGHSLPQSSEQAEANGGPVRRHQVTELPSIRAHIIEYQCHDVACPECGVTTQAVIPEEATGQFGPELTALVSYLTVVCRMPRRVAAALLKQVLHIDISLGSTQKCWEEASQAVAPPCEELERRLKVEPVLNVDETGWRTNAAKRFLWVFVAAQYIVYTVEATRGSVVLIRMLGSVFAGILCSDRFSAYLKYHKGRAQFCWAHLKRNVLGVMKLTKNSEVEQFCRDALAEHAKLFRLWHKFRDGRIDRSQLNLRSIPIQKRLFALGLGNLDSPHRDVCNLAAVLFEHMERLFAFVDYAGVEPTNNNAERALRTAVQWRKTSFGNRSAAGELATARLLTIAETCDLQKLNILVYLSAAITAHRQGQKPASLLPR